MISLILIFGCLCRSYSTGFPNPSDREIYYSDMLYQRMREKNIAPQLTAVVQNNAVSRGVWVNVQATICFSQGIWNINDGQISRLVNVDNWDSRKPQNGEVWISRDECAELIVRNWSERDMVTFFYQLWGCYQRWKWWWWRCMCGRMMSSSEIWEMRNKRCRLCRTSSFPQIGTHSSWKNHPVLEKYLMIKGT